MFLNILEGLTIDEIVIYLRKSRKDLEFGKDEPMEVTLKRHEEILQNYSIKTFGKKIPEEQIYREVVSGDTIADRPAIQKVLSLIESPNVNAVLCLEVERLARGNTIDQGIIVQSFEYSNTLIITPQKTFNLQDEYDKSFFEDGLHQARKYLEYTKRILSRGRKTSVCEGKYVGSITPYGYDKEKLVKDKGFKLVINEEEARVVKMVFDKACEGIGTQNIANYLNSLGIKPRKNNYWSYNTIRDMLRNEVYYGMIRWNRRKTEKTLINGTVYKSRPTHKDYILVEGLHEPIISKEIFDKAKSVIVNKHGTNTVRNDLGVQNPLMGLVRCSFCGRKMQRRNYRSGHIDGLICPKPHCEQIGSHLYLVEEKVIDSLKVILVEYNNIILNYTDDEKETSSSPINENNVNILKNEITKLKKQLSKAYDLLEQEVYDVNTFTERSNSLKNDIKKIESELDKYNTPTKKSRIKRIKSAIPNIQKVIDSYNDKLTAEQKNDLLKSIISEITYTKLKKGLGNEDNFSLKIQVKL